MHTGVCISPTCSLTFTKPRVINFHTLFLMQHSFAITICQPSDQIQAITGYVQITKSLRAPGLTWGQAPPASPGTPT